MGVDDQGVSSPGRSQILAKPGSLGLIDLNEKTIADLILVRVLVQDRTTTAKLAVELGLSPGVIHPVFEDLRARKLLDVHGLVADDYVFSLTQEGRTHALHRYDRCSYSSIAPVSLQRYRDVVAMQQPRLQVSPEMVRRSFADLVLSDSMLDQLGPAFAGQRSIFLYGPTGTGKTSIAERLIRMYTDAIVVPHSVELDNQIITVFDPTIHEPLPTQPPHLDPRWVACRRPLVITGGELEASMLQLRRDPQSGIYSAPLQMRANNGILMIDDFGRQLMPAEAMLNRWIVPLEKRIDYLSLDYGMSFYIPFELLVVFSTNLEPRKLGDDAFFRRIQNKVYVGPMEPHQFDEVALRMAKELSISMGFDHLDTLQEICRRRGNNVLRACYPRDLLRLVRSIWDYEGGEQHLSREVLERAAELYFTIDSGPHIDSVLTAV